MSGNQVDPGNSALYQYAVPAAVFIFAALSITIYFRASMRREPFVGPGAVVAVRGARAEQAHFDASMKPLMYEAHLRDGWDVGWDPEAQQPPSVPNCEWSEIMPLSTVNLTAVAMGPAVPVEKRTGERAPLDATSGAELNPRPPDARSRSASHLDLGFGSDPARLLISVIVRMPVAPEPTPAERNEDGDETPLPYLELGLVEVDFLHGRDNANAVT